MRDKMLSIRCTEKQKDIINKFKLQLSYELQLEKSMNLADMVIFLIKEYNKEK